MNEQNIENLKNLIKEVKNLNFKYTSDQMILSMAACNKNKKAIEIWLNLSET
jgi:hypothetical protein